MSKLKETLAKLNKNVADVDQFKLATDWEEDYFDVKFSSTGSPWIDYLVKGIPWGRLTTLTGWEGSGKSSFAILAAAEMQKHGRHVVYFDGENSVTSSYMKRLGLSKELLIHHKGNNLESMLDAAQEFSMTDEVGMIVIDSIKSFVSSVVEDKSAEQDTIGIEAKKLNARMPIIIGNCRRRNIALVTINQWRLNPGTMMGDNRELPGGKWQGFFNSLHLDFTKRTLIKDVFKEVIGHLTHLRIKKSKFRGYDPTKTYDVNFYYSHGFEESDEWAKVLVEKGTIEKKGGWYYLPSGTKINGMDSLAEYLSDNEEYLEELKTMEGGITEDNG